MRNDNRPRVTRDPHHPDFPHGTNRGKLRGCDGTVCDGACERARRLHNKRSSLAHARLQAQAKDGETLTFRKLTPVEDERVRDHIAALLAVPAANQQTIGRAAGLNDSTISEYVAGIRPMSRATAAKIMATTTVQVAEARMTLPRADAVRIARSLQALGYPLAWQEREVGRVGVLTQMIYRHDTDGDTSAVVTRPIHDELARLAARIGSTRATPEVTGMAQKFLTRSSNVARDAGYYAPEFYDADGNLDVAAIPGHPVAVANERADDDLMEARELLRALRGRGIEAAADWLVPYDAEHRNLKVSNMGKSITRFNRENRTGADMPGGPARRKHMLTVIEDYIDGAYGSPVAVVLALGLWNLNHSHVRGILLPARPADKNKAKSKHRPTEPHPGVAEAAELEHLHPLLAVPLDDTDEAAA